MSQQPKKNQNTPRAVSPNSAGSKVRTPSTLSTQTHANMPRPTAITYAPTWITGRARKSPARATSACSRSTRTEVWAASKKGRAVMAWKMTMYLPYACTVSFRKHRTIMKQQQQGLTQFSRDWAARYSRSQMVEIRLEAAMKGRLTVRPQPTACGTIPIPQSVRSVSAAEKVQLARVTAVTYTLTCLKKKAIHMKVTHMRCSWSHLL
mmetsp:Transcript_69601/g.116927  ORF Transcript_69601/g.116927 Transcript_69601/m.116927 type:complete len:207 (+) Transcript_69601:19-639(+)